MCSLKFHMLTLTLSLLSFVNNLMAIATRLFHFPIICFNLLFLLLFSFAFLWKSRLWEEL